MPEIQHFLEPDSSTLTYVVHEAGRGVVIDPVRDYEAASGRTAWRSATAVAEWIEARGIEIPFVIDTHAHADHMSGIPFFRERFGAASVTGAGVGVIQAAFRDIYHLDASFPVDGRPFDLLVDEGEKLDVGPFQVDALHTPGHTPAHMSWRIGDAVFTGDTLFMPDYGTARCDFPGGSAEELFESIQRLYAMPETTRLFVCHDYQPGGRPLAFETTVGEQRRSNVQLDAETKKEDFVAFRKERDAGLSMPKLILPSIQVNIRAGELPEPESNGRSYLKIPLDFDC